jgi:HK97 family phage major capsid protein
MATAVPTPTERLTDVLGKARALHVKGRLEGDDLTQFQSYVKEAKDLQVQIETSKEFEATDAAAHKSAGMLPLAGGEAPPVGQVRVSGMKDAGSTLVGYGQEVGQGRYRRSLEILDQYGEGIQSSKSFAQTSTTEYRDAFKSYIRRGERNMKSDGLKVLQEGIDTEGGFAVPPDILEKVIAKEPTPTRVAGRVTQLQTTRDKLVMPRINYTTDDLYTTGMRVTWTGEIPASSTAAAVTEPIFGQTNIPIFTAMMTINLSNDMIEDSGFPVISYITGKFGETIELLRDNMILNGTGQGQPSGILLNPGGTNQPAYVASGTSATIGTDGKFLVNLGFSLPEQYDMNAAWVMNKTNVGNAVAELQDLEGRFLWGAGLQDSGLDVDLHNRRLLGYPVVFSGFMPNVGANNFPFIFGDLAGYYLVNRVTFSIQVLREVYATVNQIALVGRIRFGGEVVEPWKIKVGKCSVS